MDTPKSPTPRTDAAYNFVDDKDQSPDTYVDVSFARQLETELNQAKTTITELQESGLQIGSLKDTLSQAQLQISELQKDKERLDWLEQNRGGVNCCDSGVAIQNGPHCWIPKEDTVHELDTEHYFGNSYRLAIDSAMKGT